MRSGEINKDGASETRIVHWIIAQLRARYPRGLWERQNVVAMEAGKDRFIKAGTKGQADIRGLYRGFYFELEVKKPGGVQSEVQHEREAKIMDAGGYYAVIHSPSEAFAIVDGVVG
jgi:hypothetical protein